MKHFRETGNPPLILRGRRMDEREEVVSQTTRGL
jgi:hypothetical protein